MNVQEKWFAETTPLNAAQASAIIGTGTDGVVTITADAVGTEGNAYTIAVAEGEADGTLAANLTGTDITVTLAMSGATPDDTKNTAKLIAAAISTLAGVTATYSGTGATAISTAVTKTAFEGGQYGTVSVVPETILHIGNDYYINLYPNSKYDAHWRKLTFVAY